MSNLPTLPNTVHHIMSNGRCVGYFSEAQMREYGQQCRDAALEEAAKLVEADLYKSPNSYLIQLTPYQIQYNNGIAQKAMQIRS